MGQQAQTGEIDWRDGETPVSRRFGDPYFSLQDGLAETRHVFLSGNDLPGRFGSGFHIGELGFGTGLNMLAAWQCWLDWRAGMPDAPATLRFTSFEAYPLPPSQIARALAAFTDLKALAEPFLAAWGQGLRSLAFGDFTVEVIEGDARETLPGWTGRADAWFLDGFAPAKNPELWEPALMAQVAAHTSPGGTFATYTAAGAVRRALAEAGFIVRRQPGFGTKRHMTTGHRA